MKILLTGFEPFNGENKNVTEDLILALKNDSDLKLFEGCQFSFQVLPVKYDLAFATLLETQKQFQAEAVIMLGLAESRNQPEWERVAVNWRGAKIADNNGVLIRGDRILEGAPDAFFGSAGPSLDRVLDQGAGGIDYSWSAGTFVCNEIFFKTLASGLWSRQNVSFWHFPKARGYEHFQELLLTVKRWLKIFLKEQVHNS